MFESFCKLQSSSKCFRDFVFWIIEHMHSRTTFSYVQGQITFLCDKCPYRPAEAPTLIYRKATKKLFLNHTGPTIFQKIQIIHSIFCSLAKNIINVIVIIHIKCKICFNLRLLVKKTAFQLVFCKLELELLQVDMDIYHIDRWFELVRYQIPPS